MLQQLLPSTYFRVRSISKIRSSGVLKIAAIALCVACFSVSGYSQSYPCLPSDMTEDQVVRVVRKPAFKKVTVRQELKALKAKCSQGRLIDGKKKEVKFYTVVGCWGNPPEDYLEIQDRQRRELADLKTRFTVIEMRCDIGAPGYRIPRSPH